MNYLAHGRNALDAPWRLAGTALPDWVRRLHRRLRITPERLESVAAGARGCAAELIAGVREHHDDDRWFHDSQGFVGASATVTARLRAAFPAAEGFRPSFTAHILVEMLLDHALASKRPGALDRYYASLTRLDLAELERLAAPLVGREVDGLGKLVQAFCRARFLSDYGDDAKVVERLNAVQHRVTLPALPDGFAALLPELRERVAERRGELLPETAAAGSPTSTIRRSLPSKAHGPSYLAPSGPADGGRSRGSSDEDVGQAC